jgi:hypothetical protein
VILPFAVVYAAAGFVVACRIATHLAWFWAKTGYSKQKRPDGEQGFGAAGSAAMLAMFWPLVAIAYVGRRVLFRPPADIRAERDRERLKQLETENADLDRQLRGVLRDD